MLWQFCKKKPPWWLPETSRGVKRDEEGLHAPTTTTQAQAVKELGVGFGTKAQSADGDVTSIEAITATALENSG